MSSVQDLLDRWLGRGSAGSTATLDEPSEETPALDLGRPALRTLAALLRETGETALPRDGRSVDDTADEFRRWAEHLLSGSAAPRLSRGRPNEEGREFVALERAFSEQRRGERECSEKTAAGLRQTLWAVVQKVGRSLAADQDSDAELNRQVQTLETTLAAGSVDELKQAVLAAVDTIHSVVEERRSRHAEQLAALAAQIAVMREELEEARQRMQTDGLTQLYNRVALDEHLTRVAGLAALSSEPACLLMVDIDHFKRINDRFGHPAGDALLKGIADLMVRQFPRRSDFVARYGGEEFAVILPRDSVESARALAAKLLLAVRQSSVEFNGTKLQCTVSVGIAALRPGEGAAEWLSRADRALYDSKQGGRDRASMT